MSNHNKSEMRNASSQTILYRRPNPPKLRLSMIKICDYSTIIFSGNILVLLMVALATDYWEYNGFDFKALQETLPKDYNVEMYVPRDTDTYQEIIYIKETLAKIEKNEIFYQPPIFARTEYHHHPSKFNRTRAVTRVYVFYQYSNLFTDCNDLEDGVRKRLGLSDVQPTKCINFIFVPSNDYRSHYGDAITVLRIEIAAFTFGIFCIICMVISLMTGSLGSLSKRHRLVIAASSFSLLCGMCLIVAIALFNGKSHIQRRWPLLPGLDLPFKDDLIRNKLHSFGWSFVLAWICVALNFTSSFVWLYKAQYMVDPFEPSRRHIGSRSRRKLSAGKTYSNYFPDSIEEGDALYDA